MLEIRNLFVTYRDEPAVRDLSLTLGEGEILTLVGPTGCGKTTTLRAVAGLEHPSAGEIRIGDLRIDKDRFVPPEKRRTGLVFQDFALFPHMTVEQNVAFRLKDREPVDHWLRLLGLEGHRHAMPDTLSGGQKQRVALARSLAHGPALVLLDEPLSNLDASLKASLRWEIRDALKAAGVPAIWVTHDQAEALSVGDRMGVMQGGRLEQIGPPEDCFREPASRFVAQFLGEAAFLPGEHADGFVQTALGRYPAHGGERLGRQVDVLVRPDDLSVGPVEPGNGEIEWGQYEGETRLYGVRLREGPMLRVRVNHETHLQRGDPVEMRIAAGHPLALFAPEGR